MKRILIALTLLALTSCKSAPTAPAYVGQDSHGNDLYMIEAPEPDKPKPPPPVFHPIVIIKNDP